MSVLAALLLAQATGQVPARDVPTAEVEATPLEDAANGPLFPDQGFPELDTPVIQRPRNIDGRQVVLRALDKVTAQTEDFTVDVGDTLQFGSLDVAVRHCEVRPPEEVPETFAFLQIDDRRFVETGEVGEPERVFSGWMLGSNPAKAALDHAVYDVWVIRCMTETS